MIKLQKTKGKDFIVLNLSDPQLANHEWREGRIERRILTQTVDTLVSRVKPDLITVSGDLAWPCEMIAYEAISDYLDSFGIPWAPVWGNHDNDGDADLIARHAEIVSSRKNCIFEDGPENLGNGNYVISIEEEGKPVSALIMMDSHNCTEITLEDGRTRHVHEELYPEQLTWYREQTVKLKEMGCGSTAVILHIPIRNYRDAWRAALKSGIEPWTVLPQDATGADIWNEGYESSFGINHEGIACPPGDNGFFDLVRELGSTKYILCGHDHSDNACIKYKGVWLAFATKTGCGCDFRPYMNGGTVLTVGENGIRSLHHEYVDVSELMEEFNKKNGQ